MAILPQAPADASGGFLVISYANGTDTHKMRLHVAPFSLATFATGSPEVETAPDDGKHNYAYVPQPPAGAENGVNDTFAAFAGVLKAFLAASYSITLAALYQTINGIPTEVFPTPLPTAVAGTFAGGAPSGMERAYEEILNFKSSAGGRARIQVMGPGHGYTLQTPTVVTASSGLAATEQALVGYLSGANSLARCHDGGKFAAQAHVTFGINRRLCRKYGFN